MMLSRSAAALAAHTAELSFAWRVMARSCDMIAGGDAADEAESEADESDVVACGTVPSRRESETMEV